MEFFSTVDKFIIYNEENDQCLWCCKPDGSLIPRKGHDLKHAWNPVCHGIIHGVIGKIQLLQGADSRLLLITERRFVGYLPGGHEVFKIEKVSYVTLAVDSELELDLQPCVDHSESSAQKSDSSQQKALQQTWSNLKSSAANQFKGIKGNASKELKDREKLEKRLLEELLKMFNESGSFYYSPSGDMSNTMQRLYDGSIDKCQPIWNQVDNRFFWNKYMLEDLINMEEPLAKYWIQPIIQGYFEVERCSINVLEGLSFVALNKPSGEGEDSSDSEDEEDGVFIDVKDFKTGENLKPDEYDIVLISRRSRYRAGTRYKRRGVDEGGNCANYVETEQIICVMGHFVSFVQIRGSVPVFWSQPGHKYKPPPLIDKDKISTQKAFASHFDRELATYKRQVIINLVEQVGREKIIGDAFIDNIITYDSPHLRFVNFDFHEYCRGMKFHNVAILIDAVTESLKAMKFCWVDTRGLVDEQRSVFRINCMDCLDRTNVVQATIARAVLENQLRKLGRMLPEHTLPLLCRRVHNHIWANNGDAISRQYAGTAAMKGDFTRTGERKFTGLMKDGYKSANRYYLNRFRDTYRQAVIDIMLGNPVSEDFAAIAAISKTPSEEENWTSDREECLAQLVVHSQKTILPPEEDCLGGWALVDPLTFAANDYPQDEDVILLLTSRAYYVARYDDAIEQLISYERVALSDLDKIEIGPEYNYFKGLYTFMRLHHRFNRSSGFFHTLRTVQNRTIDEAKGILLSISEIFTAACEPYGFKLRVLERNLDKRKTKPHRKVVPLTTKRRLSKFSEMSLPDIDADLPGSSAMTTPKQFPPVQLPDTLYAGGDSNGVKFHVTTPISDVSGRQQEFETWVSMEPEGEVVERRRLKPLPKSNSDSALDRNGRQGNGDRSSRSSKIDAFVNKTKTIFNAGKLKKSFDIVTSETTQTSMSSSPKTADTPSWDPNNMPQDKFANGKTTTATTKQARFRGLTAGSALKAPLRGLQEKIKDRLSSDRSSSSCADAEDTSSRQDRADSSQANSISSGLRIFSEIRNRFSASPKPWRKTPVPLSEEEVERRRGCRTEIIDV